MKQFSTYFCLSVLALSFGSLQAITNLGDKTPADVVTSPVNGELQAGAIASKAWLELVDKGGYDKSWDEASTVTKRTVSKGEWNKILTSTRKPLGSVKSREVVDLRVAVDPNNLPAGNYMVMIYKTSFASKPSATELVTLFLQNGQWHVLTYQVD